MKQQNTTTEIDNFSSVSVSKRISEIKTEKKILCLLKRYNTVDIHIMEIRQAIIGITNWRIKQLAETEISKLIGERKSINNKLNKFSQELVEEMENKLYF